MGSVVSGAALAIGGTLRHWLEPVTGFDEAVHAAPPAGIVTAVILAVVAAGVAVACRRYATNPVPAPAPTGSALTVAARNDLYGDAFNERVFMRPGAQLARALTEIDDRGIDGAVGAAAALTTRASVRLRRWQTGFARSYALSMLAGAVLAVAAVLGVRAW
ncbi:hypothetical protein A5668_05800 [Mycolicibacterium fortuitum]|nr:hypothetical protein A5668_05800 [Mycolicibacterium fortuitum]